METRIVNQNYNPKNGLYLKIVGITLAIIVAALLPVVVSNTYYLHIFIMVGINAILAMTFIFLMRIGLISMSIAAFWGVGAYASALLVMKVGLPFWVVLPTAAVISSLVSFVAGYILVRSPGSGFVILSIVLGMVVVLVFGTFYNIFGGYPGIQGIAAPEPIPLPFGARIVFDSKIPYYYLTLFLLLFVVALFASIYTAWSGRAMTAIGLSPMLAEALGIDTFKYRLYGFAVAGGVSGLIGSFYAHYIGGLTPGVFDVFKTINIQIYAILGGVESAFLGPVLGSVLMTLFPEFMRITEGVEPIITGLLLIILIIFLPNGLLGIVYSKRQMPNLLNIIKSTLKRDHHF